MAVRMKRLDFSILCKTMIKNCLMLIDNNNIILEYCTNKNQDGPNHYEKQSILLYYRK